jgi:hypothetical protein
MSKGIDKIAARLGSLRRLHKNVPRGSLRVVLFEDLPKLLDVAKAAKKISGHTPYCICEKVLHEDKKCRCGSDSLLVALKALDQPEAKDDEAEHW